MMASQTSLKVPIMLFIVGSVFIYIPTGFKVINQTIFGYSSPLKYSDVTSGMNPIVLNAITGLIGLIGLISFIRGWMILVAHAQQPGGQATLGKALTHIIGGLFAMNVLGVIDIIWNTFGLTNQIS
jgi:intracellular multiplication protein IcmC